MFRPSAKSAPNIELQTPTEIHISFDFFFCWFCAFLVTSPYSSIQWPLGSSRIRHTPTRPCACIYIFKITTDIPHWLRYQMPFVYQTMNEVLVIYTWKTTIPVVVRVAMILPSIMGSVGGRFSVPMCLRYCLSMASPSNFRKCPIM